MSLQFPCSGCGKTISVATSAAGKAVRCPQCQAVTQATLNPSASSSLEDFYQRMPDRPCSDLSENPYQSPIKQAANIASLPTEILDVPTHPIHYWGPSSLLLLHACFSLIVLIWISMNVNARAFFGTASSSLFVMILFWVALFYQGLIILGAVSHLQRKRGWAVEVGAILAILPLSIFTAGAMLCFGIVVYPVAIIGGVWTLNTLSRDRARAEIIRQGLTFISSPGEESK